VTRKLLHGGGTASSRWCSPGKAQPSGPSAGLANQPSGRYKNHVEFRILGPLEVADGHGAISLDAPKQRALLGVLLLHANEVVSSERLIDELWGERPPATATKVVQNYVSQLRKALGPDVIVTRPPGYVLRIEGDALDSARFHDLTSEGRTLAADGEQARAAARYEEALALWRGPALADVVFESFARNEVEALEEERLGALMDRIDCELALGRQHQLVAELETLVGQYPLRERLRAQLMLALYRSGRQADALTAYREARRTLRDELGLEPSGELHTLERAILTHDASLEASSEVAHQRPARSRLFKLSALPVAALVALAVAFGLALALGGGGEPTPRLLASNSVGFIDAESGRVTKSFSVGREPRSLTVANDSVWVANYRDRTVTRLDRASGRSLAVIPVGGHPTSLTTHRGIVWVWMLEGRLVPIDPRFDSAGEPLPMGERIGRLTTPVRGAMPDAPRRDEGGGRITSGGGFLWVTVPLTTVIRVNPVEPEGAAVIVPDDGARAAIAYRNGEAWVAGYDDVFPIETGTGVPGAGILVGLVRDLAFGAGSLWAVCTRNINQRIGTALRRVDLHGRVVEATINVGNDPVAVALAGGSIWVASRSEQAIRRVDPGENRVVQTTPLGAQPTALAADADGIWVAVG
jgi:DNA-binding SARP family transcriptional activator/DNA-binding beta-propeller fold protein YncE